MQQKYIQAFSDIGAYLQPLADLPNVTSKAVVGFFLRWLMPIFWLIYTKYLIKILEQGNHEKFVAHLMWVLISLFLYFVIRFLLRSWTWVYGYRAYKASIYQKVLPQVIAIDNNAYDQIGTGNLIHVVEKWCGMRAKNLTHLTRYGIEFLISFAVNMYFIGQLGWWAVLGFVAAMWLFGWIMYVSNLSMLLYRRKRKEADQKGMRSLVKMLMSKFDILQNDKTNYEIDAITKHEYEAIFRNKKMSSGTEIYFTLPLLLIYVCVTVVFYFWWERVLAGTMLLSQFYGIVWALFIFQGSVWSLLTFVKDFSRDYELTEKMVHFLQKHPRVQHLHDGKPCRHADGDIVMDQVEFCYTTDTPIIQWFDLTICGGKRTALVWPSWSWKTTLIKLIAWYIHPTGWMITIGWQQLPWWAAKDPIALASLYSQIWYLTQEPSVFDGTVLENITYACQKPPTKKQLTAAISAAQCQFIYDLPQWLETEIGEKWVRLSGGQRQRLAIAKIMLKNPQIVLLDEPTSALDSFSEEEVTHAMQELFVDRTVIVVAHRLQTVKNADEIIYIAWGNIIERGTHEQLVAAGGEYAKMLELQSWF
jgi:ABC-type multidrug transport system fused ATPase/permease subunit